MYFVVAATDVDNFVGLVRKANLRFLLDLNLLLRYAGQWDPTETANLLGYVTKMGFQDVFNFELGNGEVLLARARLKSGAALWSHARGRYRRGWDPPPGPPPPLGDPPRPLIEEPPGPQTLNPCLTLGLISQFGF